MKNVKKIAEIDLKKKSEINSNVPLHLLNHKNKAEPNNKTEKLNNTIDQQVLEGSN